jgi:glycosyltransferase involved in cell wall biosynthesis
VQSEAASRPSVALAIPAYNESDGIGGFLQEIDRALSPHVRSLHVIVVDDSSTDETAETARAVGASLTARVQVVRNPTNLGHGASVVIGYQQALAVDPDFVLQVDGDGQFHGSDLRRVLVLLIDEAHAVCGVRRFRQDPWFRMAMTRLLRAYVRAGFGVAARDPNCPLRGYEARLLAELMQALPSSPLIPNLYLTVIAARRGVALLEVDVSHRVRRAAIRGGTSWRQSTWSPVPWRLVRFSLAALKESRSFRDQMDTPSWARAQE